MKHVSVRPRFADLALFFVLVLSFWCVSVVSAQWNQLGADIDWHHEYSLSGYAVSLSLDGNRVAIGARRSSQGENGFLFHAGQVQVFDYDGAGWTKVGLGIDGEAIRDYLGWSVSLTPDGNRVAVGAPNNDGGGIDAGYVQIFDYVGGNWTQVGNDIEGEAAGDLSGWAVSLSSDGQRVAIGAPKNDGGGSNAGQVRVFEYDNGSWTQVGGDVDGDVSGDQSGWSVALSPDGNRIAIGAPNHAGSGSEAGQVRVFEYDNGSWTQIGSDIDGDAAKDYCGRSVSFSSDGNRLAVGAPNHDGVGKNAGQVRIYEFSGGNWTQLGADIDGEAATDGAGWAVSLSSDGQRVAIGARGNDDNGIGSGQVRIYDFSGGSWIQAGEDINGEAAGDQSGWSVALSPDGSRVAIGAIMNHFAAGHVRVYIDCPFSPNDLDSDCITNNEDNCPSNANTNQEDRDMDGTGDACDNCLRDYNPLQEDADNDLIGDVCDKCPFLPFDSQLDDDGDGVGDECDNCPHDRNASQTDRDNDGVGNQCDNCPVVYNPGQEDADMNGIGDACEPPGFDLSPNPATHQVQITSVSPDTPFLRIELFDQVGNRVLDQPYSTPVQSSTLLIGHLQPGSYLLKITTENTFVTTKLVLE